MEKTPTPNATTLQTPPKPNKNPTKKKLPTPQELISHYQSQGLEPQEASTKVIEDLQGVIFRLISANNRNRKGRALSEATRKIDVVANRLGVVDMKLDSKPGFVGAFGIGLASGAALRGFEFVWPHVLVGVSQIWTSFRGFTKPPSS